MDRVEKLFCFDAFGVLHNGKDLFPKVKEALLEYKKNGKVVILTNSTFPSEVISEQLKLKGLTTDFYDKIISSGDIFIKYIKNKSKEKQIKIFSKEENTPLMEKIKEYVIFENSINEADYIYVSSNRQDISDDIIVDKINQIENIIQCGEKYSAFRKEEIREMKNKIIFCINPDIVAMNEDKIIIVQGFQGKYLIDNFNLNVVFFGKPYHYLYQEALDFFNIESANTFMFGDQISTDIIGAKNLKINPILVKSNVTELTKDIVYPNCKQCSEQFLQTLNIVEHIKDFLDVLKIV